jgi:CBS domain-containing protein
MAKKVKKPLFLNHNKLVKDFMQKDVITVKFDTFLVDAIAIMKEHGISGLIVVDNIGEYVGVVSAFDMFKAINEGDAIENMRVEDLMTPFTITIYHDDNISTAAQTMMENNIHRLVVTESPRSKRPIGIVTSTDLINNLL